MPILALIPGLLSVLVFLRAGLLEAFLGVYLPTLLLLPDYFRWIGPGLPDPTPNAAAILPLGVLYLATGARGFRPSFTDALVLGFGGMTAYTEYRVKGYSDAQNLVFDVVNGIFFPYVLAKGLIEPANAGVRFGKRIVVVMTAVTWLSFYELRMGKPLFRILLDPFFPGQGAWVTTFRYGLARVAGPYGHAILAGLVWITAYRIQRWLEWSGAWKGRVGGPILGGLRLPRARYYTAMMLVGSLIPLVRGPWLGGLAGGAVLLVARHRNRSRILGVLLAGLIVVGIPVGVAGWKWASVGRANAVSASQETAAYRKELIEKYWDVAMREATWGWGRGAWPQVPGLPSTDNHYLLLALNHGVITLGLFLAILWTTMVRLIRFGARRARGDPDALLAFNLAGIYAMFFVALATVYHGMQSVQVFFLVTGWADGLLLVAPHRSRALPGDPTEAAPAATEPSTRRILTGSIAANTRHP